VFVVAAILLTSFSILLFIGAPLLQVFASALRDSAGAFLGPADLPGPWLRGEIRRLLSRVELNV